VINISWDVKRKLGDYINKRKENNWRQINLENVNYYDETRLDLLNLIPCKKRAGKLLEIGAAAGNTLIYAKNNKYAKEVYGIELCKIDDSNQKNNDIKSFVIGNIEEIEFPFSKVRFDVILIGGCLGTLN
jgi:tRNA1(Val) A37 N6-methylase TrmN6